MGGKSSGTWSVNTDQGFGVFDGEVLDVPKLKAPGFIKAAADGKFKDVSADINGDLVLRVKSTTPEYDGFRASIVSGAMSPSYSCAGGSTMPFSGGCYKAKFHVKKGKDFQEVRIPINKFSDHWSPYTGDLNVECKDDKSVCITEKALRNIQRVEIWAEGASGKVHLEVKSIELSPTSADPVQSMAQIKRQKPKFL